MRCHYENDKSSQLFSRLSQSQTRAIEKVVERCADSEKKERKLFKSLLNAYLPEWEKALKKRDGINDRKP